VINIIIFQLFSSRSRSVRALHPCSALSNPDVVAICLIKLIFFRVLRYLEDALTGYSVETNIHRFQSENTLRRFCYHTEQF
jgi:hypothetical protein